jgi:HEAT repeat protein
MLKTFLQTAPGKTDLSAAKLVFRGFVIALVLCCTSCGSLNQEATRTEAAGEPAKLVEKAVAESDNAGAHGNRAKQQEADALAAEASAGAGEVDQTAAEQTDDAGANLQVIDAGDPANLPVFRQAINDKDPAMREAAVQALAGQGPVSLDLLREAFQDSDPKMRLMVVESIGSVPEASVILQEASGDADAAVREAAQRALDLQASSTVPVPEAPPEQVPGNQP